eukprot:CAMPEP_0115040220 /NCGR_PEP_ID=MMETSP0216-20121206/44656_1 /TAXON_ID=223996 /ORGANISM="Protocruzia adherens, Strain Boccale" /LENGTH=165 /DNA_ID=CAMNT_0002421333 /DNA_START=123 /DNA_END=617 /DNA_ORIENTATION=+
MPLSEKKLYRFNSYIPEEEWRKMEAALMARVALSSEEEIFDEFHGSIRVSYNKDREIWQGGQDYRVTACFETSVDSSNLGKQTESRAKKRRTYKFEGLAFDLTEVKHVDQIGREETKYEIEVEIDDKRYFQTHCLNYINNITDVQKMYPYLSAMKHYVYNAKALW